MPECLNCGASFAELVWRPNALYCSQRCRLRVRWRRKSLRKRLARPQIDKHCVDCGNLIPAPARQRKRCVDCAPPAYVFRIRHCEICGTQLSKWQHKFCSAACRATSLRPSKHKMNCLQCGSVFETWRPSAAKFCSTNCSDAVRKSPDRRRDYYRRAGVIDRKRQRRTLIRAVRNAYNDLLGIEAKPKISHIKTRSRSPLWFWEHLKPHYYNRKTRELKRCLICNAKFTTSVCKKKYCSRKCNKKAERLRWRERSRWLEYQRRPRRREQERHDTALLHTFRELNLLPAQQTEEAQP